MKKFFDKTVLVIFSVIVLIIGVVINLLAIGWLDWDITSNLIGQVLVSEPIDKIILVITEILMLFALIEIFTDSDKKERKSGRDVLMQNDNGKLMISRDTIENITEAVVKDFEGVKQSQIKIQLDNESNVLVFVDLTVVKDVIIKELTLSMQNKIKEIIKKTSDLEVKQVNVRIKNIVDPVPAKNEEKE